MVWVLIKECVQVLSEGLRLGPLPEASEAYPTAHLVSGDGQPPAVFEHQASLHKAAGGPACAMPLDQRRLRCRLSDTYLHFMLPLLIARPCLAQ